MFAANEQREAEPECASRRRERFAVTQKAFVCLSKDIGTFGVVAENVGGFGKAFKIIRREGLFVFGREQMRICEAPILFAIGIATGH
jgi:hypothetical protein